MLQYPGRNPLQHVESKMRGATGPIVAILSLPFVLALGTCDSSDRGVTDPCPAVEECDFEGQFLCMTDTSYRECVTDNDGCLVWDCST